MRSFIGGAKIPHKSGVYIFKDKKGDYLYVGKAVDLYSRVSSYFREKKDSQKTSELVKNIVKIEVIEVSSELEALILEANLIKTHLPTYNIRLTDDKDYLYISITKEDFPKIVTSRKQNLSNFAKYFGPFPSSRTVKETLKKLRKVFPWCSNPQKQIFNYETQISKRKLRACFYYHLGLCPGACVGKISVLEYQKIIKRFSKFLEGKKEELLEDLGKEMKNKAENLNFEQAQKIKKIIDGIIYLTQPNKIKEYLTNPNFLEDERSKTLEELQKILNLKKIPTRIEGYDISNTSGTNATGSMVVLTNGEIDKSEYRKFKIHISGKINDYAMHQEMMKRRLNHKEWPIPDLILIDGGRGQVSRVSFALKEKSIKIPIFGLAKRLEWIYGEDGLVIKLPKRSKSLQLLQLLRDEAHRFAISYHRKLRSRKAGL